MRSVMARFTRLVTATILFCLMPSSPAFASEINGKDILDALRKDTCAERKNIKRVRCMEEALDSISSHLGVPPFSTCIPQHGKAPRIKRKPFKEAMKMWFPSKRTIEFIRPDLSWDNPQKPLGIANLEECISQTILSSKQNILSSTAPQSCQIKPMMIAIPEEIETMGNASGRLLSVLAASTGREADVYYSYEWKAQDKSVSCRPQSLAKGSGRAWEWLGTSLGRARASSLPASRSRCP